jgi:hypothetical protein
LNVRTKNLFPYVNRELAHCRLQFETDDYSIYVEPLSGRDPFTFCVENAILQTPSERGMFIATSLRKGLSSIRNRHFGFAWIIVTNSCRSYGAWKRLFAIRLAINMALLWSLSPPLYRVLGFHDSVLCSLGSLLFHSFPGFLQLVRPLERLSQNPGRDDFHIFPHRP